jgi:hypothetical protein
MPGESLLAALARAQADWAFRAGLMDATADRLRDSGVAIPTGIELRPVDPAPGTAYIVLPAPPAEGEVADGDLAAASGGVTPLAFVAALTFGPAGVTAAVSQ